MSIEHQYICYLLIFPSFLFCKTFDCSNRDVAMYLFTDTFLEDDTLVALAIDKPQ